MRAVLISIQPKWCELIASGKKTVEVRKNKPKLETPFKVYIYCTEKDYDKTFRIDNFMHKVFLDGKGKQKIIGEFICDKIYDIKPHYDMPIFCNQYEYGWKIGEAEDCLSFEELDFYLGGKCGYGWHISDLKLYDEPKELNKFYHTCKQPNGTDCSKCRDKVEQTCWSFTKPPQSWCYTEI